MARRTACWPAADGTGPGWPEARRPLPYALEAIASRSQAQQRRDYPELAGRTALPIAGPGRAVPPLLDKAAPW